MKYTANETAMQAQILKLENTIRDREIEIAVRAKVTRENTFDILDKLAAMNATQISATTNFSTASKAPKADISDSKELLARISLLQREATMAKEHIASLQSRNAASDETILSARAKIEDLESRISTANEDVVTTKNEIVSIKSSHDHAITTMQKEKTRLEILLSAANNDVASAKAETAMIEASADQELLSIQTIISTKDNEIMTLKSSTNQEMAAMQQEKKKLEARIVAAHEELVAANEEIATNKASATKDILEMKDLCEKLMGRLSSTNHSNVSLAEGNLHLKAVPSDDVFLLKQENESLRARLATTDDSLASANAAIKALKSPPHMRVLLFSEENDELRARVAEADKQIFATQSQLIQLKDTSGRKLQSMKQENDDLRSRLSESSSPPGSPSNADFDILKERLAKADENETMMMQFRKDIETQRAKIEKKVKDSENLAIKLGKAVKLLRLRGLSCPEAETSPAPHVEGVISQSLAALEAELKAVSDEVQMLLFEKKLLAPVFKVGVDVSRGLLERARRDVLLEDNALINHHIIMQGEIAASCANGAAQAGLFHAWLIPDDQREELKEVFEAVYQYPPNKSEQWGPTFIKMIDQNATLDAWGFLASNTPLRNNYEIIKKQLLGMYPRPISTPQENAAKVDAFEADPEVKKLFAMAEFMFYTMMGFSIADFEMIEAEEIGDDESNI